MKSDSVSKEKGKQPYRQKKVKHLQKTTARLESRQESREGLGKSYPNSSQKLWGRNVNGTHTGRVGRPPPAQQDLIVKRKTDIYLAC